MILLGVMLPQSCASTSRVIIAHRLNTIENVDEIFFVNWGEVISAVSFNGALDLLMHGNVEGLMQATY